MSSVENEKIDQALFGYSEGHRQIAASIRLPAADLYRLSAASDLAAGAKLTGDDSYLTGVPLEESKRYALIRTWAAPELPRPGCVWSHVLLLDTRTLSSCADLHELLQYFQRPREDAKSYGVPIVARTRSSKPVAIDGQQLQHAIEEYYSGRRALLPATLSQSAAEGIVTAIWSQQWPRLRAAFVFRTARTERRKSDLIQYDVQVDLFGDRDHATAPDWAIFAANDAATRKVTDLRRFLWRYGRDISAARANYRVLVELFIVGRTHQSFPVQDALRVFRTLSDAKDGEILKGDILGAAGASPSLSPPISPIGLLEVLTDENMRHVIPQDIVSQRFRGLDPATSGSVARFLDQHYDVLEPWRRDLENAIILGANSSTLSRDFPPRFLMSALRARPELISRAAASLLSDNDLIELLDTYPASANKYPLVAEVVRRDFGAARNGVLLRLDARRLFEAALDAMIKGEINPAWEAVWSSHANEIFAGGWPRAERSWYRIFLGISRLGYPRRIGPNSAEWVSILASALDDLQGDDRIRLWGYLLRTALDEGSSGTWDLCAKVLPELRPIILAGALPDDVYRMLSFDLPTFNTAGFWDINRRILICLSYLSKRVPSIESEEVLGLSDRDRQVLNDGAKDEESSRRSRFWWF